MVLIVILGLLVHYVADFLLQTREQAELKSVSFERLTDHTITYSTMFAVFIAALCVFKGYSVFGATFITIAFSIITFICHTITDAITSRLTARYFKVSNWHNGFAVVGADQILHYLQLYYTYKLLL